MYDGLIMFQSKSKDVYPGSGSMEKISENVINSGKYDELNSISNWRQKLSNFYKSDTPFMLDGYRWNSVETYFQCYEIYETISYFRFLI